MKPSTDLIPRMIILLEREIVTLQARLNDSSTLDGTPYMVLTKTNDLEMVLGCWPERGWKFIDAIPNDLCGILFLGREDSTAAAGMMLATGKVGDIRHVREELRRRILANMGLINQLKGLEKNPVIALAT